MHRAHPCKASLRASWTRVLLVVCVLLLPGSACGHPSAKDACASRPRFPALQVGRVTTPTEIDLDVTLVARGELASRRPAYWRSLSVDRADRSPEGAPWKNDDEFLASAWVSAEDDEPVIHLGLVRFAPRTSEKIVGKPLTLHLTFEDREAPEGCPRRTQVDVELTLFSSDAVPLGVKDFRWRERPARTGR